MKYIILPVFLAVICCSCQNRPEQWKGDTLTTLRDKLTVKELVEGTAQPLIDMSYFAKPSWGNEAIDTFSGTVFFEETTLTFPKEKEYYPGENIFPKFQIDFIAHKGELIPNQKHKIITRHQSQSLWDVVLGTGKIWYEKSDQDWSRASFPLTLTDRYVGQARNCVATFVFKQDSISNVCLQCSQETADVDDKQLGNISGIIPITYEAKPIDSSFVIINQYFRAKANRLVIKPLSEIDPQNEISDYLEQMNITNAPTSLGAVLIDNTLYLHPPKTRHGLYPYPEEMRHGLYSVTKSMAGGLAMMYFDERYEEDIFDQLITDYVPALSNHPGWQGVSFSHTLNMVTGTVGSEGLEHFYSTVIAAETAEEIIHNIAQLGDMPEGPGLRFNYASANQFVLSYAIQKYVEEKEGIKVNYWDLVHKNVLEPIGAKNFSLLHTIEDKSQAIPILALGALPTIDEAAKIALLFANMGAHNGQQILNKQRVQEVFGKADWKGHSTNNDFRGDNYQHAFWSRNMKINGCDLNATYMLGFGENYIVFLPSGAILFRFYDEHDLNISPLIESLEKVKPSCR